MILIAEQGFLNRPVNDSQNCDSWLVEKKDSYINYLTIYEVKKGKMTIDHFKPHIKDNHLEIG